MDGIVKDGYVSAFAPPRRAVMRFKEMVVVRTLEKAIAEVADLPEAAQEKIGQQLLAHVEKLRALRADLDVGVRSLDAGGGKALDAEEVIRRARERHGRG